MMSSSQPESKAVHHLARFVTREAISLLLNLKPHEIYRIDCWQHVIQIFKLNQAENNSYI